MSRRSGGLTLPLLLIAIGVVFLLVNTGRISSGALERLGDLWPLLLIILGVQLVLNHSLPRSRAQLIGLLAAGAIVLLAIGYAVLNPVRLGASEHREASGTVGSLTAATLDLSYGGATVDIGSAAQGDQLFNARVDYPGGEQPPDITFDRQAGRVEISPGQSFALFRGSGSHHISVNLSSRVQWSITISGGAASANLQLSGLSLAGLEISGGANRLDVSLPKPSGELGVKVSGGASALTLRAPAGSQWKVSASGGVSTLDVNGHRSSGVGNVQQQSDAYAGARDRLTIDVSGGVSQVQLLTG